MMVGGWQLPARNVVARFGCGFRLAMDKAPKLGELWQVLHRRDFFGGCPRASASSARFSDGLHLQVRVVDEYKSQIHVSSRTIW
jgi:hypothetical protein